MVRGPYGASRGQSNLVQVAARSWSWGGDQVKSGSGKCRLSWYDPGHAKQKGLKGILIE